MEHFIRGLIALIAISEPLKAWTAFESHSLICIFSLMLTVIRFAVWRRLSLPGTAVNPNHQTPWLGL